MLWTDNCSRAAPQANSEIMLMNGRVDGKTAAVWEEVNKTWNPASSTLVMGIKTKPHGAF